MRLYERMVTLHDGTEVSNYSEEWRHECEARAILNMTPLAARRAYLYGTIDKWGKLSGGIDKKRGQDALKALEATMVALWTKRNADAKAAVMGRTPGTPLAANDNDTATVDERTA